MICLWILKAKWSAVNHCYSSKCSHSLFEFLLKFEITLSNLQFKNSTITPPHTLWNIIFNLLEHLQFFKSVKITSNATCQDHMANGLQNGLLCCLRVHLWFPYLLRHRVPVKQVISTFRIESSFSLLTKTSKQNNYCVLCFFFLIQEQLIKGLKCKPTFFMVFFL
jgi:hypothetical protein